MLIFLGAAVLFKYTAKSFVSRGTLRVTGKFLAGTGHRPVSATRLVLNEKRPAHTRLIKITVLDQSISIITWLVLGPALCLGPSAAERPQEILYVSNFLIHIMR